MTSSSFAAGQAWDDYVEDCDDSVDDGFNDGTDSIYDGPIKWNKYMLDRVFFIEPFFSFFFLLSRKLCDTLRNAL